MRFRPLLVAALALITACTITSPRDIRKSQDDYFSPSATRERQRQLFHSKLQSIGEAPNAPQVVYVVEEKSTDVAGVLQYGSENAYKLDWHIDYNTTTISSVRSQIESNIAYRRGLRASYGTTTQFYRVRAINMAERPWP